MKLSVVIPTLNEEKYLPVLLGSLLRSKIEAMDIIVVDGKSEDKTREMVKKYGNQARPNIAIRCIVSDKRNVAYQRNLGAKEARHDIILFLDADTKIPFPDVLERFLRMFVSGKYAAVTCRFSPVEPDWRASLYYNALYSFQKIMKYINPYAVGSCILTRKDVLQKTGGFDPSIRINEDANFVMRAARYGTFEVLPITIEISARRFLKYGYLRTGIQYMWIFLKRTFRGEIRDNSIPYEFGKYD